MSKTAKKFRDVIKEVQTLVHERDDVITGCLLALLCQQHVQIIGAPGSGKSYMAREIAKRLSVSENGYATFFEVTFSKLTKDDDLF